MNKCKVFENFIDAEVFIPESKLDLIKDTVTSVITKTGDDESAPTFTLKDAYNENEKLVLPTYIKTNEFTQIFQMVVNTYGVPRYKEFNPTVFNMVTFPLLFGMMFGDIAHGLILFVFGMYLIFNQKAISQNTNSKVHAFLPARYILSLMGFWALYCGFIYNDFASIAVPLSPTCYENKESKDLETGNSFYYAKRKENCYYYFGIDHKWHVATNNLTFLNSFKMKISVIVGVLHMTLGIIIKGLNCAFFNDWLGFFCEFIPQLTFMTLIFGYMDFMIIYKWCMSWKDHENLAPNITSSLLNMFLKLGAIDGDPNDDVRFLFLIIYKLMIFLSLAFKS